MHPITQTLILARQSLVTFTRITRGYLIFLLVAFTIFGVVTTVQGYIFGESGYGIGCAALWCVIYFQCLRHFKLEPKHTLLEILGGYVLFLMLFIIAAIWLHANGIPLPPASVAR